MIEGLEDEPRLLLRASLIPAVGSTFQPTGFPDLGPAEFDRPIDGDRTQRAVLVESVQSLANHLEGVAWDATAERPVATIAALPYVEVRDKEARFLTSSRLEPHRLAGAYIKDATIDDTKAGSWMISRLGVEKGVPLDWRSTYAAVFALDPMCLIHGVFFSDREWRDYGNPKVRRALTASIEAHDVRPVISGGVKRDDVYPTAQEGRGAKEGYGFVPFGRTEYTASKIELNAAVDIEQINGYGLGEHESRLLVLVALWQLRMLLDRPLRLRTACDLELEAIEVRRPAGFELPSAEALAAEIAESSVSFDSAGPHAATYTGKP